MMHFILLLAVVGIGLIGWAVWHYVIAPYFDALRQLREWDR